MRLPIILLFILLSFGAWGSEDSEVRDLFNRYERIVSGHETHLIDEVFSARFLKDNGGKKEFIEKVKSEPKVPEKSFPVTDVSWKKGVKSDSILAKLKASSRDKSKGHESHNEFIIVKENGKLKIDGTVGDAD